MVDYGKLCAYLKNIWDDAGFWSDDSEDVPMVGIW